MSKPLVSIISPVYGCQTSLVELYFRIKENVSLISENFEIILIDDKSPDDSWNTIIDLNKKDPRVKGIKFSRNFGQHKAIYAGVTKARGEWVVVMDCDLQDRPEEIINLYQYATQTQSHVVLGRRVHRRDALFKRILSKLFYYVLGYLTDTQQDSTIANFGIYHRKVINAVCAMGDDFRYFPTMVRWVGFKQSTINIKHDERIHGKTSYSLGKLLRLGSDVVLAFSEKPLKLTIKLGLSISGITILIAIYTLIRYLQGNIHVLGYASLFLSVWFFGGIIIFIIGVIGLYIGKIFEKVKGRPVFIVEEETVYE